MATSTKHKDRRFRKTRNLLRLASIEVMREKSFSAMTIQDIADRANVNRGTFYAHFADKYELLKELIHERFQYLLSNKLPPQWNNRTLHIIIQIVLELYEDIYRQCEPPEVIDPIIEKASREELTKLLLIWLKEKDDDQKNWQVPMETIARVISWTILGAAAHWSQERTVSLEQAANEVLLVLMEGVARIVPKELTE